MVQTERAERAAASGTVENRYAQNIATLESVSGLMSVLMGSQTELSDFLADLDLLRGELGSDTEEDRLMEELSQALLECTTTLAALTTAQGALTERMREQRDSDLRDINALADKYGAQWEAASGLRLRLFQSVIRRADSVQAERERRYRYADVASKGLYTVGWGLGLLGQLVGARTGPRANRGPSQS
jgi:hypothetical protein